MRKLFVICALVGLFYAATRDLCEPAQAESKGRGASEQKYIKVLVKRKPADKDWKLRDTRTIELLDDFQPGSKKIRYSKYGGRVDRKAEAKGFFYPKKVADRWWLVDPDGNLFVHIGVCSVRRGRSEISQKPAKEKFGTPEKWAEFTTALLAEYGFNGIGGWSDAELLRATSQPPAYTLSWNFMGSFGRSKKLVWQEPGHLGYPNRCIPVFHPDFEKFCDEYAKQLSATKDDPWLIGHFSDNEMPEDLSTDPSNRDSNKGIINYQYKPYVTLLQDMKKLNNEVYALIDYFDAK